MTRTRLKSVWLINDLFRCENHVHVSTSSQLPNLVHYKQENKNSAYLHWFHHETIDYLFCRFKNNETIIFC